MSTTTEPEYRYLRAQELAERWGTTTRALAQLRYRQLGPSWVRIPNVGVRYRLDEVEAVERAAFARTALGGA